MLTHRSSCAGLLVLEQQVRGCTSQPQAAFAWLLGVEQAAHQAIMSGKLAALDKCPGAPPAGVSKIWRRLTFNCCKCHTTLVTCDDDGTGAFMLSKEGVAQGAP